MTENEEIEKEREELREKLEKENVKEKTRSIDYYKEMQLINQTEKYMGFRQKDIFVVEKVKNIGDEEIVTYEIYNRDKQKIARNR